MKSNIEKGMPVVELIHATREIDKEPYLLHGFALNGWDDFDKWAKQNVVGWNMPWLDEDMRLKVLVYGYFKRNKELSVELFDFKLKHGWL